MVRSEIGPPLALCHLVALDFGAIDTMQSALTFHRERHTVLAGNVANLDTPGYRPMDLDRKIEAASPGLAADTTHAGHIAAVTEGGGDSIRTFDDGGQLQGPDGNAVSMERELSKIDANRARYATTAELVSRRFALLKYAAGDGG